MLHNLSGSLSFHMEWLADSLEDSLLCSPGGALAEGSPELQGGALGESWDLACLVLSCLFTRVRCLSWSSLEGRRVTTFRVKKQFTKVRTEVAWDNGVTAGIWPDFTSWMKSGEGNRAPLSWGIWALRHSRVECEFRQAFYNLLHLNSQQAEWQWGTY